MSIIAVKPGDLFMSISTRQACLVTEVDVSVDNGLTVTGYRFLMPTYDPKISAALLNHWKYCGKASWSEGVFAAAFHKTTLVDEVQKRILSMRAEASEKRTHRYEDCRCTSEEVVNLYLVSGSFLMNDGAPAKTRLLVSRETSEAAVASAMRYWRLEFPMITSWEIKAQHIPLDGVMTKAPGGLSKLPEVTMWRFGTQGLESVTKLQQNQQDVRQFKTAELLDELKRRLV
jgi:hypothetical protein